MTAYRCLVVSAEGRSDWRNVDAADAEAAVARLLSEGVTPLDVRTGKPTLGERLNQPVYIGGKLRLSEQALVLSQLATLLRSGLPIDRSLDLIREQAPRAAQRDLLGRVVARVREGGSLAVGFEAIGAFPRYVTGVIRSAERGGGLAEAMTSVAERLTLSAATRTQLITALSYPAAVLAATVMALLLVLTTVVPQFAPIFEGQEARLPTLTRLVLWLSDMIEHHGLALLTLMILGSGGLILAVRASLGSNALERYRHRLPGLALLDQYMAAQFIGIFATLVGNGITVVAALPLARDAVGTERWRRGIQTVEQRVREGTSLSVALARSGLLPSTAVRLIEVGERSAALADTCAQASAIIGQAAKARLDRTVALANPIAIVTLGGLVGSLVAGVMLGIFSLGDFAG